MLKGDVATFTEALSSLLEEVDRAAMLEDGEMGSFTVNVVREGLKIGADGWVDDDLAFIQPWGFSFDEIKVPVLLYQGSEDKMVPYSHGEWFAKHLPQDMVRTHLIQGEGHMSIFLKHREAMMDELLQIAN